MKGSMRSPMKGPAQTAQLSRARQAGCGRVWTLLIPLVLMCAGHAFAQSCAMCYSTAAATAKEGQRAIDKAVIVLLLPPLSIMTVGIGMAFRYGRKRDGEHSLSVVPTRETPYR